jgi:hypothetical protein
MIDRLASRGRLPVRIPRGIGEHGRAPFLNGNSAWGGRRPVMTCQAILRREE